MAGPRMRFFGVGDSATDLMAIPDSTFSFCLDNGLHVRSLLDARHGAAYYMDRIYLMAYYDITFLPILGWTYDGKTWRVPNDDTSRNDWQTFCYWVGAVFAECWARYGRGPDQAEIWNEPNLPDYGGVSPYNYVGNILKPARTGLKQSTQAAIIVGGLAFGTNGSRLDASEFISTLYNNGGISYAPLFDAIAIHPYGKTDANMNSSGTDWTPQRVSKAQNEINRALSARQGNPEPLIVSETGRPLTVWTLNDQKAFIEQVWGYCASRPIKGFSVFHCQERSGTPETATERSMGIHDPNMNRRPAAQWLVDKNNGLGRPWTSFPIDG